MQIACPSCQKQLRVPDTAAGKKVKCPSCATMFQAIEVVEDQIQPSRPARPAKAPPVPPPLQKVEEERPRGRRRPVEEVEEEDDRPRSRRRPADDEDDDRPRSRRRRDEDDDDDDDDRKADRKEARRRGRAAALWFVIAGIVTLIMMTLSIGSNLYITATIGAPNAAYAAGRVMGLIGCGAIGVLGGVFHFLASSSLKSLQGKGRVVTAIVFGFIFGVLFGIGVVVNIMLVSQVPAGFLSILVFLAIAVGLITSIFNLIAAIRGITTLNNRAVSREFRRSA